MLVHEHNHADWITPSACGMSHKVLTDVLHAWALEIAGLVLRLLHTDIAAVKVASVLTCEIAHVVLVGKERLELGLVALPPLLRVLCLGIVRHHSQRLKARAGHLCRRRCSAAAKHEFGHELQWGCTWMHAPAG